jgi:hypothetical protein
MKLPLTFLLVVLAMPGLALAQQALDESVSTDDCIVHTVHLRWPIRSDREFIPSISWRCFLFPVLHPGVVRDSLMRRQNADSFDSDYDFSIRKILKTILEVNVKLSEPRLAIFRDSLTKTIRSFSSNDTGYNPAVRPAAPKIYHRSCCCVVLLLL